MATLLKREIQARLTKQGNNTSLNLPHEVLQAACLARGDTVTITTDLTTLMSLFQSVRYEGSSPDQLGSKSSIGGRAWQGAALKDVGDKLVWGCWCQALVIAAPTWLEARPRGFALVGWVTIGGELALRGAGHRAANLYAVDPPGAKP